jgi:hypothetical protein
MELKPGLIVAMAITLIAAPAVTLAMEISVFPTAEIDEVYNSNVGLTSNNTKGDWITAELFGGKVEAESPHRDFYLTYSTVLAENAWYSNLDRFGRDHNLQLNDTEELSQSTTLHISDTFLMGNAASGQYFSDSTTPISPQLMSVLLYNNTTQSNDFSAGFTYVNPNRMTWTSEVHQLFYSNNSSSGLAAATNGFSFDQGGSFAVTRLIDERFTAGFGYQFDDFLFTNRVPSAQSHSPTVQVSWGLETPFSITASAGPVIVSNSNGLVGLTPVRAQTQVEPGFNLAAKYTGERFNLQAAAGESSGLGAGFAGQTKDITVSTLAQYKLTRRTLLFANIGYLNFSGSAANGYSFSYTAGASYRLTRHISLTAQYYGYRTLAEGAGATAFAGTPGQAAVTNVFLFGVVFQAAPWRWQVD